MATHTEGGLVALTSEHAYESWYLPRRPAHVASKKLDLHDYAASHIGFGANLQYLEFGVARGTTLRRFASIFMNPAARFVGFDSFMGLPENWNNMEKGAFSTDGNLPDIPDPRVEFKKGWFQNTVREFFLSPVTDSDKITLVHFDADLYSSTLFLLSSLWWHVPDYFFIFDEFIGHELAALRNFVSAYPVDIEFYTRVDTPKGLPEQIFGRMRATRLVVDGID